MLVGQHERHQLGRARQVELGQLGSDRLGLEELQALIGQFGAHRPPC